MCILATALAGAKFPRDVLEDMFWANSDGAGEKGSFKNLYKDLWLRIKYRLKKKKEEEELMRRMEKSIFLKVTPMSINSSRRCKNYRPMLNEWFTAVLLHTAGLISS